MLRYISAASSKAASAARFLCNKVPASKTVCATLPATVQNAVPGVVMNWLIRFRGGAGIGSQRELRKQCSGRDADLRTRCVQLRFRRTHIRALIDQFRRQADRQILRQLQRSELEPLGRLLVGRRPIRAVSRSRCTANCFRSGGNVACACANVASTAATSAPAIWPSSNCLRRMSSEPVWILMISSVAATGRAMTLPAPPQRRRWRSKSDMWPRAEIAEFRPSRPAIRPATGCRRTRPAYSSPYLAGVDAVIRAA